MKKKDGGCEEILYPLILYQNNPTDEQECEYMTGETYSLPMVALRGLTILPEEVRHFDVSREKSLLAIEEAVKNGQKLFVSAQKDLETEEPGAEDVYHKTGGKITEENESCTCIRRSKSKSCKTGQ